jgi:hypothetical protein
MPRRRLDFEATRDALLEVSGALDRSIGGPSVKDTLAAGSRRRTLYGYLDRFQLPGAYRSFDFPSPDSTAPQRDATTVSPQALFMMNHPLVHHHVGIIAKRPEVLAEREVSHRLRLLYQRVLSRPPSEEEIRAALNYLERSKSNVVWEHLTHSLIMANEFVFLD